MIKSESIETKTYKLILKYKKCNGCEHFERMSPLIVKCTAKGIKQQHEEEFKGCYCRISKNFNTCDKNKVVDTVW